jgi:hypothetical protein
MAQREIGVIEVREILRTWLADKGLRGWPSRPGWTARRCPHYVDAAVATGLDRDRGEDQLTDELPADRGC